MKSTFDKIAAGLSDAIAFVEGDSSRAAVRRPVDIRAIRERRNMTQAEFSETYRLPVGTVRDWEQHRREPDTGSKVYLAMIEADPEGVEKILSKVGLHEKGLDGR